MAAYAAVPGYLRSRHGFDLRRSITFIAIGLLHLGALAALLASRDVDRPPQPIQPMTVTFIAETPPEPVPPPPEPAKPQPQPQPQPKMVATPKPTPSAMTAPPLEKPTADEKPAEAAPPSPPAPAARSEPIPPNFMAAYLNNPGPKYPQLSIKLREQGTVMLLVLVNEQGRAEKALVEISSGHSRLDEAAVEVVERSWRFVPAKQGDQAVSAWVRIPMNFHLNQR
ncbi:MAG: energy transducer TonB [Solimonas sp.]